MRVAVKRLPGVTEAEVSFGRRRAAVTFAPGNRLTLAEVQRQMVLRSLRPLGAELRAAGTVALEDGRRVLLLESGERFLLEGLPLVLSAGAESVTGARVELRGQVAPAPVGGSPRLATLHVSGGAIRR